MANEYDLVVIGAGSGGVRAARIAASLGASVAIVEGRFFGGTCVNVGCVPKKMFAYASEFSGLSELAADFGFNVEAGQFDWSRLRANKDKEIARLNGVYERLLSNAGVNIFLGYGRITASDTVVVGDETLKAKNILIATGGQSYMPEIPGAELALLSDDLFVLPQLPKTAIVVGGGYIACEFASILSGLGVTVQQLYRGELFLRGFDRDIREHVAKSMRGDGIEISFNADVVEITRTDTGKRVTLTDGSTSVSYTHLTLPTIYSV